MRIRLRFSFSQHLSKNIQPHIEACCQRRAVAKNSDFQSRSSSAYADVPGDLGMTPTGYAGFVWTQTLLANLRAISQRTACKIASRARDALLANILNLCSIRATDKNHPHICALPAHTVPGFPYATLPFWAQTIPAYPTVHNEFRYNLTTKV